MLNGLGLWIENIKVSGLVFNPDMSGVILCDRNDQIGRKGRSILTGMAKHPKMNAVIARKAIACTHPYKTILILDKS